MYFKTKPVVVFVELLLYPLAMILANRNETERGFLRAGDFQVLTL